MGFGLVNLPGIVIVSNYFEKKRSFALGIATAGGGIGTLVLAPVIELMEGSLGWAVTFMVLSGIVLLGVPLAAVFRPVIRNVSNAAKCQNSNPVETTGDGVFGLESDNHCKRTLGCIRKLGKRYFEFFYEALFVIFLLANFFVYIGFAVPFAFTVVRNVALS